MEEIFSDSTRRYKKSLILVCSIALVFYFLHLKIEKITLFGSESSIGFPYRIPWIILIIILYFFVFYIYYITIDYKIWKSKIILKPFEDKKKIHLSGGTDLEKSHAASVFEGIENDKSYASEMSSVEKMLKKKFWVEASFPLILSLMALVALMYF